MMIKLVAESIIDRDLGQIKPGNLARLTIILVGDDPDSKKYIRLKQKKGHYYGLKTDLIHLPVTTATDEVVETLNEVNTNSKTDGLIVQLPLPIHIDHQAVIGAINPTKDVDNLTGRSPYISPMVQGIGALEEYYQLVFDEPICVVGVGPLVGAPVKRWLESRGFTPVIIRRQTENKDNIISSAEVIISGAGNLIVTKENVGHDQIIIDCTGRDVDFNGVKDKVKAITPPTGSIGPLTVHFLFVNTLRAAGLWP